MLSPWKGKRNGWAVQGSAVARNDCFSWGCLACRGLVRYCTLVQRLAAVLLLLGCSGDYEPYSSVTAGPLLAQCEAAAERWYAATGLRPGCTEGPELAIREWGPGAVGGITTGEGIAVAREHADCAVVILHELGHAMVGGGHGHPAEKDGSAMASRHNTCDEPLTAGNLRWFCERAPCQWEKPE